MPCVTCILSDHFWVRVDMLDSARLILRLLPNGKMRLMEGDALGVVGHAMMCRPQTTICTRKPHS